jgi:hypothetical protein
VESVLPRFIINTINTGKAAGLIYFLQSRTLGVVGTPFNSTIQEIKQRGHLQCGIADISNFAKFNQTTMEWSALE